MRPTALAVGAALGILALLLVSRPATAATYVVAQLHPAASDGNPGGADKPFKPELPRSNWVSSLCGLNGRPSATHVCRWSHRHILFSLASLMKPIQRHL